MATWPTNLPAPLRAAVAIHPGSKHESNQHASGRCVVRNWAHPESDRVTVQFNIPAEVEPVFNYFFHRVALDSEWFTAEWLDEMGYDDHKARILGYPKRKGINGNVMTFSVVLLIQLASACIDQPAWPDAGTGGEGESYENLDGLVVGWGNEWTAPADGGIISGIPEGLRAVKVLFSQYNTMPTYSYNRHTFALALKADGTFARWGEYNVDWLADIDAVGIAIDFAIAFEASGVYYINSAGIIGHVGSPKAGTSYPAAAGFTKIYSSSYWAIAEHENGSVYWWGTSNNGSFYGIMDGVEAPLKSVDTFYTFERYDLHTDAVAITDNSGSSHVWEIYWTLVLIGVDLEPYIVDGTKSPNVNYEPPVNENIIQSCIAAKGHMVCYDDLSWWGFDEMEQSFTDIPALIEPTQVSSFYDMNSVLAINEDGEVVGWGEDVDDIIADIPFGFKAHQLCVGNNIGRHDVSMNHVCLAIQRDDGEES